MFTNTTTRTSIVRTAIVAVAVLAVGALGNSAYAGDNDSSWALQHSKQTSVAKMDRAGRNVTPTQTGRVNYYKSFGDGQTVARIDAINNDTVGSAQPVSSRSGCDVCGDPLPRPPGI